MKVSRVIAIRNRATSGDLPAPGVDARGDECVVISSLALDKVVEALARLQHGGLPHQLAHEAQDGAQGSDQEERLQGWEERQPECMLQPRDYHRYPILHRMVYLNSVVTGDVLLGKILRTV